MEKGISGILVNRIRVLIVPNADLPLHEICTVFVIWVVGIENVLVRISVFTQLSKAKHRHHIDGFVVYHQTDVAHITTDLNEVFFNLSPKDYVEKDFQNLLHCVLIYDVFISLNALNNDDVQAILIQNRLL